MQDGCQDSLYLALSMSTLFNDDPLNIGSPLKRPAMADLQYQAEGYKHDETVNVANAMRNMDGRCREGDTHTHDDCTSRLKNRRLRAILFQSKQSASSTSRSPARTSKTA